MDVQFRIAQITDDPAGVLTGAFVFSPPPQLPDVPRVLVERFGGENTKLGPHGWAVDSKGLRPRVIEKRGPELWLCFGAEVSFHVLPNTPVRISIPGIELEGTEIWPPIPRGRAPPADIPPDDALWPEPPKAAPPPPPPPPPKVEEPPPVVAPPPEPPPPPPPPPPQPPPPPPETKPDSKLPAIAALLLLLAAGGGAAWWFTRTPPEPTPPRADATPASPASPDCAGAEDVLSGKCSPQAMIDLPAAEQTRLGEALLGQGDRRAGDLGVSLLSAAASRHNHGPAQLALGRLYDPATFRQGGPFGAPNPARALDLFGKAAESGLADARTAREALVARLKQEAAGADQAAADRAAATLRGAGIE